jgi:hypothetical protein
MEAGICLALALIHLTIWLQQRKRISHPFFSLAATGAAANAIIDLFVLAARDADSFGFWFGLQNYAIALIIVSLVCFVYVDFGTARPRLAITIFAPWLAFLFGTEEPATGRVSQSFSGVVQEEGVFCCTETWENLSTMESHLASSKFRALIGAMKVLGEVVEAELITSDRVDQFEPDLKGR